MLNVVSGKSWKKMKRPDNTTKGKNWIRSSWRGWSRWIKIPNTKSLQVNGSFHFDWWEIQRLFSLTLNSSSPEQWRFLQNIHGTEDSILQQLNSTGHYVKLVINARLFNSVTDLTKYSWPLQLVQMIKTRVHGNFLYVLGLPCAYHQAHLS